MRPRPPSDAATRTASVADVRLRLERTSEPLVTPARERRGALRLFAAAAVVLLAVVGGVFYTLRSRVPKAPAVVEPAPTPTAVPVSPPTAIPVPTAAAPATPPAPEPGSVAEAAPLFVTITFESNANALLSVDGKTHRGLPAPVRVSLKSGRHTAVFEVPGYMKKTETFEVRSGGSSSVRVNFPPWGILDVGSEPSGAEVLIDGAVSGKTPLKKPLPIGAHLVELRLGGHESSSGTHEVRELESTRVFANLKKTP